VDAAHDEQPVSAFAVPAGRVVAAFGAQRIEEEPRGLLPVQRRVGVAGPVDDHDLAARQQGPVHVPGKTRQFGRVEIVEDLGEDDQVGAPAWPVVGQKAAPHPGVRHMRQPPPGLGHGALRAVEAEIAIAARGKQGAEFSVRATRLDRAVVMRTAQRGEGGGVFFPFIGAGAIVPGVGVVAIEASEVGNARVGRHVCTGMNSSS
jgi:hypothetical protein